MPDERDDFEPTVNLGGPDDKSCLVVTIVVPYTDVRELREGLLSRAMLLRGWYEAMHFWHESNPKHGTSRGIPLTDEVIEELADEAERGYDAEELRLRARDTD